ncbi:UNVERIFIED_CONTAM: hypothetical protein K2H54_007330 [Gekko kuhli]
MVSCLPSVDVLLLSFSCQPKARGRCGRRRPPQAERFGSVGTDLVGGTVQGGEADMSEGGKGRDSSSEGGQGDHSRARAGEPAPLEAGNKCCVRSVQWATAADVPPDPTKDQLTAGVRGQGVPLGDAFPLCRAGEASAAVSVPRGVSCTAALISLFLSIPPVLESGRGCVCVCVSAPLPLSRELWKEAEPAIRACPRWID